jgi:histidinol-phosphate aminotransferase
MSRLNHLLRPDIAALGSYTPVVPVEVLAERLGLPVAQIVKLDANENPYGPAPRALAALADLSKSQAMRSAIYPDPEHTALRRKLSTYLGQPIERIVCGAGSDELIDLLMRLTLTPGSTIIDCPPTFGMYAFNAGLHAANVIEVPRTEAFDIDIEAIADAVEQGGKLLFLPAPNNPTGNPLARADLLRLLELPMLLVVDEAYAEFAGISALDLVGTYPNLVVLRTFSKWAGLAGLRVGYGVMHEELASQLWKIKQPYNVNVAALVAAEASLDDAEWLMANVARLIAERERLSAALASLPGLQPYPSAANFILCRVHTDTGSAADRARGIRDDLRKRGVLVRYYARPDLCEYVRFSVGTPEQNDTLLRTLGEILGSSQHN